MFPLRGVWCPPRNNAHKFLNIRLEELRIWERMQFERNVLVTFAYVLAALLSGVFAYFMLLYAVTFTAAQNTKWLTGVALAAFEGTLPLQSVCARERWIVCV